MGNPHDPGFADAHLTESQGRFLVRNMPACALSHNSGDTVFSFFQEIGDSHRIRK
jgi:hypothetical protein